MLLTLQLKRIAGFILVLGIAGAICTGPSKAQGLLTPTAATRFGAADEEGYIIDMDAITTADGKSYLAVLEQRTTNRFPWVPMPPDGPFIPAPPDGPIIPVPRPASSGSAAAGPSGWIPGIYRDIGVLRVIDVTTEPWVELFSKQYEEPNMPIALTCDELPRIGGRNSKWSTIVLMSSRLEYYNPDGDIVGETVLPIEVDGHPVTAYNDFDVAYIGREPLILVAGCLCYSQTRLETVEWAIVLGVSQSLGGDFVVGRVQVFDVPGPLTKVACASDGTSIYCALLGEVRDNDGKLIRQTVSALEGATGEDPGTVRTLLTSEDPKTEFVDVAAGFEPIMHIPMYLALANEKEDESGTKAVVYAIQDGDILKFTVAEPCEPAVLVRASRMGLRKSRKYMKSLGRACIDYVVAGNTDGPIKGGPPAIGGADIWLATVELDYSTDPPTITSEIDLYGGEGDDGVTALAFKKRPTDAVKKKASRMGLCAYLGCYVDSGYGFWATQAVGGIGTDPVIIELKTRQEALIGDLIAKVESMDLHHGIENSLTKKLENAQKSLAKGNNQAAANKLQAFINTCMAKTGSKLTVEQADELIDDVEAIMAALQ